LHINSEAGADVDKVEASKTPTTRYEQLKNYAVMLANLPLFIIAALAASLTIYYLLHQGVRVASSSFICSRITLHF
jgi:hypothetical protein